MRLNAGGAPNAYYVRQAALTDPNLTQLANEQARELATLRSANHDLQQQLNDSNRQTADANRREAEAVQRLVEQQNLARNIAAATRAALEPLL